VPSESAYLYWLIIGCEVAFWVVLGLALTARYVFKHQALNRSLLFALPAVDLLLLVFTALDLRAGTPATFAHGLATVYVGFTVAFGPVLIRWADQHFAHRFAGGPPPAAAPRGWRAVRQELELWLRSIVAWIITVVLLGALIAYIDNEAATSELFSWYRIAFGSIFLWFVFGPLWSLVFFRREMAK
jgi:hypothetical protein